jgi:hypothetical protein
MLRTAKNHTIRKANVPFQAFTLGLQAKMNQETPKRKQLKRLTRFNTKTNWYIKRLPVTKAGQKPGHR